MPIEEWYNKGQVSETAKVQFSMAGDVRMIDLGTKRLLWIGTVAEARALATLLNLAAAEANCR